jgi:hypothetical protein
MPMVTSKQLDAMSELSIETLEKKDLVDISAINIRKDLPPEDKILNFLGHMGNPYCFRCGNVSVRVCFSENGTNLETALQNFFIRIQQS